MHRLSVFFHYIICNINQIVDRADTYRSQTSLHPFWRWSDLNVLYDPCTVSWAKFRILNSYFDVICCIFVISCRCNHRWMKLFVKCSCSFSCNTYYTEAVYTVGRYFVFYNNIVQSKLFDRTLSHNCIIVEDIDSVFRSFRIHLSV